jgi:hypothetical protein
MNDKKTSMNTTASKQPTHVSSIDESRERRNNTNYLSLTRKCTLVHNGRNIVVVVEEAGPFDERPRGSPSLPTLSPRLPVVQMRRRNKKSTLHLYSSSSSISSRRAAIFNITPPLHFHSFFFNYYQNTSRNIETGPDTIGDSTWHFCKHTVLVGIPWQL